MTPAPSQPPITPMHFISRCTWKVIAALHYDDRDGVIHSHMHFMLVFHQSKCISATKCILFYYLHVRSLEFVHGFVCSLSLRCMPRALRVGVKTLYAINFFLLSLKTCK